MSNSICEGRQMHGIGLNPNIHPHYTDHLAVVCIIMGIPLLFTDEEAAASAKKWYPGLKTLMVDWQEMTPDFLVREYDVLFQSDLWPRDRLYSLLSPFEKKYQKIVRNVHCPHGFSDKIFWLQRVVEEDITLIYGPNMIDMLEEQKIFRQLNGYVITGNYRYRYYKENKAFYDAWMKEEILAKFQEKKPILFYAPSWNDQEHASSFPEAAKCLLRNVPAQWNLLVKLHPRLYENHPIEIDALFHPYRNHPHILFVEDCPLVYPLLECADAYVGDRSSIGYDFLALNRPLYILNTMELDQKTDRRAFLHRCARVIEPDSFCHIYAIIEKNYEKDKKKYDSQREEIYRYTFGEERTYKEIKNDILAACEQPRPVVSPIVSRPLWH